MDKTILIIPKETLAGFEITSVTHHRSAEIEELDPDTEIPVQVRAGKPSGIPLMLSGFQRSNSRELLCLIVVVKVNTYLLSQYPIGRPHGSYRT